MQFLIIGLGKFGTCIAENLKKVSKDFIGIDKDLNAVQTFQDSGNSAFQIDATKIQELRKLPLNQVGTAIICLGPADENSSFLCSVLLREFNVKKIIIRYTSEFQETALNALDFQEFIGWESLGELLGMI